MNCKSIFLASGLSKSFTMQKLIRFPYIINSKEYAYFKCPHVGSVQVTLI